MLFMCDKIKTEVFEVVLLQTVQCIFNINKKIELKIRFPSVNQIISSQIFILIFIFLESSNLVNHIIMKGCIKNVLFFSLFIKMYKPILKPKYQ